MAHNGHNGGHHNGYNRHSMPFGYHSVDGLPFDNSIHNFNQQPDPILTDNDSDFLTNFFNNPESASTKASGFPSNNSHFGMDGKVEGSGSGGLEDTFGNLGDPVATVNPASTVSNPYRSNYQTHANHQQMQYLSQLYGNAEHMTPDDMGGVQTLATLGQGTNGLQSMGHNAPAISWGDMGMPAPNTMESPVTPHMHSAVNMFAQNNRPRHPSFPPQQIQAQSQMSHQQMQYEQAGSRARNLSLNANMGTAQTPHFSAQSQYIAQPFNQQVAPSHYQYGTDPNIGQYSQVQRMPSYAQEVAGKAGNLMGVPLLAQAANERPHSQASGQLNARAYDMQNMSRNTHGFNSSDSSPGAQYGGLPLNHQHPMANNHQPPLRQQWMDQQARVARDEEEDDDDDEPEEPRSRKRRKSQMQREEEDEYQPDRHMQNSTPKRGPKVPKAEVVIDDKYDPYTPNNRTSSKRRKSLATGADTRSRDSDSPDDMATPSTADGSTSRGKSGDKSRANLSENQKRQNHILSEQKRRNIIGKGYKDLDKLIPCLSGGKHGLSKAEVLQEAIVYLRNILDGNDTVMDHCGITEDDFSPGSDGIEAY